MPRSSEVTRQFEILRELDSSRVGVTIARLASKLDVHQRTIRRDIQALCNAGFALYDEKVNGTSMWKLRGSPFRDLASAGLSTTELAALYLARTVLESHGAAPMADELARAFAKLEQALPEPNRRFLDRLPVMIKAKHAGQRRQNARRSREILARLTDAALMQRRVEMQYHSLRSKRTRRYEIDPHRITSADGGVYVTAWVPEYEEMRTFALERIRTLSLMDEKFELRALPPEPFANSLGPFTARPELVEIEFDPDLAEFIASREWHRSQETVVRDDGSLLLRMCVSIDPPLRRWILGFGDGARVVSPRALAREIFETIQGARERYMPRLTFEPLKMTLDRRKYPLFETYAVAGGGMRR